YPLMLLATLLLAQVTSVTAGVTCYAACCVACCEVGVFAFAGPLGIAVGYTGCAGVCMVACATALFIPPACFANDTTITVSSSSGKWEQRLISNVNVGDQVLTMVNGQPLSCIMCTRKAHSTSSNLI